MKTNPQSGQTLIETITAILILTMALVSGLSLAIYSSQNSAFYEDQIVASNLAREGVEVVRMMRDTNWLQADYNNNAQDFYEQGGGCTFQQSPNRRAPCYPDAFHRPFDLNSSNNDNDYRANYDSTNLADWRLERVTGKENYLLCLQPNGMYRHNDPGNSGIVCTNSATAKYARRITITLGSTTYPYTTENSNNPSPTSGHSPELVVTSYVVWQGRRCTPFPTNLATFDPATFYNTTECGVRIVERMSNWKDYR